MRVIPGVLFITLFAALYLSADAQSRSSSRARSLLLAFLERLAAPNTPPPPTTTQRPVRVDQSNPLLATNITLPPLTTNNLLAMRDEFRSIFHNNSPKVNRYVQMGFHICIGGCDGCLNLHDSSNAGLVPHYNELRNMHRKWENVTSLADYAVISTYEAIKVAVGHDSNRCNGVERCQINLPFTSGRFTCMNPDNPPKPEFPKGEDITTPSRVVGEPFKLTNEEMVALMGCHSLGAAHSNISGFNGDWDLTPNVLDHGYFEALTKMTWRQKFIPSARSHQWVSRTRDGKELMMLHADMTLLHRFSVRGGRKQASCSTTSRCSKSRRTSSAVERFARDNRRFIQALGRAVAKMCNTATFDKGAQVLFQ